MKKMNKSTVKSFLKTNGAKRVALSGVMLALALIVSLIESMIPPIVPMLPYAKLGLTNVVLLACFMLVGVWEGYVVLVLKCLLSAVYAGNFSMLVWSLPSALVAYTVMVLLHKTKLFSVTGLSMVGGMLHNFTQILVATVVVGKSVFFYLPYMLLAGGLAGFVTGVVCHFAVNGLGDKFDFKGKKNAVEEDDLDRNEENDAFDNTNENTTTEIPAEKSTASENIATENNNEKNTTSENTATDSTCQNDTSIESVNLTDEKDE